VKICLTFAFYVLCLTAATCSDAAAFLQPATDCEKLQYSTVINPERPFEIAAQGFSVLPPKGEGWCYRLFATAGIGFFKIPEFEKISGKPPTRDEFAKLHIFSGLAMSLKGLAGVDTPIQNPEDLKTLVGVLIREHLFTQMSVGIATAEHRFRLLDSNVVTENDANRTCVRFEATVEERGSPQAPELVFLLNLASNVVCRHSAAPEMGLIWVSFVERYLQGDQPNAHTLKEEYEPYVQSLRFMPPR
jgi:hypothetical protein